jgi:hypothetical protein
LTELTPLHEALLELGLEDWIPLPEIFRTPEVRDLIDKDQATEMVSRALVDLLKLGLIQIWAGQWSDEPRPIGPEMAEPMLLDERRYSFDSEAGGLERVFFVNVDNFRA